MKHNLLVALCCLLFTTAFSQRAFEDANFIATSVQATAGTKVSITIDNSHLDTVVKTLMKYKKMKAGQRTDSLLAELADSFAGNPFIVIPKAVNLDQGTATYLETNAFATKIQLEHLAKYVGSSLDGFNVTNIADGLAQFLIKRGKAEISVAFIERLKKFLEDPNHPEIKTLLPTTSAYLLNMMSYQYNELIQGLREAFQTDLSNLVINLNRLGDLPKYKDLLTQFPEIRIAIRSARIISELSQSGSNEPQTPDNVIADLDGLSGMQGIDQNLASAWHLLYSISESINSTEGGKHIWVTLSELNKLVKDPVQWKLFLGLLYESIRDISFSVDGTTVTAGKFFKDNADNISVLSAFVENFALLANDLDRTIADITGDKDSKTDDDYYSYINKAVNMLDYGFKLAEQINPGIARQPCVIIAQNAGDLYRAVYTKNYGSAAAAVCNILSYGFANAKVLGAQKIKSLSLDDPLVGTITNIVNAPTLPQPALISNLLTYINFFAAVVKAQSAADVEAAIEAAALPAGSYSIKQHASCNISFNGYIGYGVDFGHGQGIYAPVGFFFGGRAGNGSVGLFIPLLDVGSIASYRLSNNDQNTADLKQEIRLESIFAPGAQFMYGFPKWPLVLFGGVRMSPRVFYAGTGTFTPIKPAFVASAGAVIDIPVFTLFNKSANQ